MDPEGEYKSLAPAPAPMTIWFGTAAPRHLLYFTKESFLAFLGRQSLTPTSWLAIVCASFPTPESLKALGRLVEEFGKSLTYVGDLRPMDLTHFALLRRGSPDFSTRRSVPLPILYGGINDAWLGLADSFRRPTIAPLESKMRDVERMHFEVLQQLVPDLESLVGERSFALLKAGHEVNLEMTYNLAHYREGYARRLIEHLNSMTARPVRARVARVAALKKR